MPPLVRRTLASVRGVHREQQSRARSAWLSTVLITLSNGAGLPAARLQSWQLNKLGLQHAVAALDSATSSWARGANVPVFQVAAWGFDLSMFDNQDLDLSDQGRTGLACTKVGLMRSAIAAGFDPLLLDADIAFLKDPLPLLAPLVHRRVAALYSSGLDEQQLANLTSRANLTRHEDRTGYGDARLKRTRTAAGAEKARAAAMAAQRREVIYRRELKDGSVAPTQHRTALGDVILGPAARQQMCSAWREQQPHLYDTSIGSGGSQVPTVIYGFINAGFVWLRAGGAALDYTSACLLHLQEHQRDGDQEAQHASLCQPGMFPHASAAIISPTTVQLAARYPRAAEEAPPVPAAAHAAFNRGAGEAEKLLWLVKVGL